MDFQEYFKDIDLKKIPKVGLHFEQKITPDLLWCVALVILDITKSDTKRVFTDKDNVRKSVIFNDLMRDYFGKAPQSEAEDEYNKLSSYQLDLLVNAGLVEEVGQRPKKYKVADFEALNFIAVNDLNAAKFLTEYTDKFVKDNGLWSSFEVYLSNPTQQNYVECKESYWRWAKINTDVRTNNPQHSYRVYNKIFNVLCYKYRIPGQHLSNISEGPCPYSYLIYNRDNFRDKDKPNGMTRQAYIETVLSDIDREGYVITLLKKAKDSIARKYGDSEITDPALGYLPENGIHVHHIIPVSHNPEFSLTRENLIALTPGQHLSYAHVRANTKIIDTKYQAICLKTKLKNILQSLDNNEDFYDYSNFINVINACYGIALANSVTPDEIYALLDSRINGSTAS